MVQDSKDAVTDQPKSLPDAAMSANRNFEVWRQQLRLLVVSGVS
jgi:hypothetical protein